MRELITIKNTRGYLDENGTAYLSLEDVARGLGFTEVAGSGKLTIRWRTIRRYLGETGIATSCDGENEPAGRDGLPEFIPENIFYKLCFKASNPTARAFQDVVTDEVLPSIRKHGAYMTEAVIDKIVEDPDFGIHLLTQLKNERAKNTALTAKNEDLSVQLNESEKFWTIMKFNQHFNMGWDMKTCKTTARRRPLTPVSTGMR